MVDEAHGTGCVGPGGRGAVAAAGLEDEVDVLMGTLGKALGGYGAYVCGSAELVEYLINAVRPFIFSTALPPSVVAAAGAALELLAERPARVDKLAANAAVLRDGLREEGLAVGPTETQIVPVDGRQRQGRDGPLRARPRAGRVRPGDPPADGPPRHQPPAHDGDGDPQGRMTCGARRR